MLAGTESFPPVQTLTCTHHPSPFCSYCPCVPYTFLPHAQTCQMLENSSSAQDYTGSPGVIRDDVIGVMWFLTQTQRDLGNSAGSLPRLQGISKEGTRRKGQWQPIWGSFSTGTSCSSRCNCKVDTQHPQPPLRWDIIWDIAAVEASASPRWVKKLGVLPGVSQQLGSPHPLGLHEEYPPSMSPSTLCLLRNYSSSRF